MCSECDAIVAKGGQQGSVSLATATPIPPWARSSPPMVWGKWGKNPQNSSPYPLLAHLLDSGAMAFQVWDRYLSETVRNRFAGLVVAGVCPRLAFSLLVALHDCGKCEPVFQEQRINGAAPPLKSNFEDLLEELPGLTPGGVDRNVKGYERRRLRHENMSGYLLSRQPGSVPWVSTVLSGHHGWYPVAEKHSARVPCPRPIADMKSGKGHWATIQDPLVQTVIDAILGPNSGNGPGLDEIFIPDADLEPGLIPHLTGFVILADWLASDETFVRNGMPLLPLLEGRQYTEYFGARIAEAKDMIDASIGPVLELAEGKEGFEEAFGNQPRAIQEWADDQSPESGGLTIICAPAGEGKTEAALWLHRRASVGDGIFFGLPTMATADGMFPRVLDAFQPTRHGHAELLHSLASLNEFYASRAPGRDLRPVGVCDGEEGGSLTSSDWLRGRHRGMLAPISVGTCDQALAAALTHRHVQMKLAALSTKHVILDEVHTYDAYQQHLLGVLLGWLGSMGSRVTLLSATLPAEKRNDYLSAYYMGLTGRGLSSELLPDPALYPAIYSIPSAHREDPPVCVQEVSSRRNYQHAMELVRVEGDYETRTAALVEERLAADPHTRRIAVIVNTVDRAVAITKALRENREGNDLDVLLIHSRMTARAKRERAEDLGRFAGKSAESREVPLVIVATQIAEASLDFDVDLLITDICPMPSLFQRMGRQWRHSSIGEAGWQHPAATASARGADFPTTVVLMHVDSAGELSNRAHFPYMRAEIQRTREIIERDVIKARSGLISIPQGLQGLVNRSVIGGEETVSALNAALNDGDEEARLLSDDEIGALLDDRRRRGLAEERSVTVGEVRSDFKGRSAWNGKVKLVQLAGAPEAPEGPLQTRLIETINFSVLPYCEDGSHELAWKGNRKMLGANATPSVVLSALDCSLNVSGRIAGAFLKRYGWPDNGSEVHPAFRETHIVSMEELAQMGISLDYYGMTMEPTLKKAGKKNDR